MRDKEFSSFIILLSRWLDVEIRFEFFSKLFSCFLSLFLKNSTFYHSRCILNYYFQILVVLLDHIRSTLETSILLEFLFTLCAAVIWKRFNRVHWCLTNGIIFVNFFTCFIDLFNCSDFIEAWYILVENSWIIDESLSVKRKARKLLYFTVDCWN